ncbi:porin, partial [Aquabacterium sp.]|uniref:porin n=1 Tax=Aquabacterium sp. TaxID=1872578 RepID=UPI002C0D8AD3
MKKLLIACTTLAAAPLVSAQSNVTVYGLYDAAVRHASNAGANRESLRTMEDGIFTGTRLGFRGREDLGDGLAAVFTLEAGFDPSAGTSLQGTPTGDFGQATSPTRFFGREAHVGLRAPYGALTLGRQYTVAHAMAARFQAQGNPNSLAHSLFSSHHIARQDNMLRLDAKLGPVDLAASTTFGEQTSSTSANGSWALSAGTTQGPVSLGAYFQKMKNLLGSETREIVGLGGNVKLGEQVTVFGGAMQRSNAVSVQKNRAWTLGANLQANPFVTVSAEHYRDDQSGSAALDGARTVSW